MSSRPNELITRAVHDESRPITYKELSRKLELNVNEAKELMEQFVNSEKQFQFFATYYYQVKDKITGDRKIILGHKNQLDTMLDQYQLLSSHVYSIQPQNSTDYEFLANAIYNTIEFDKLELLRKIRVITGEFQAYQAPKPVKVDTIRAETVKAKVEPVRTEPVAPKPKQVKSTTGADIFSKFSKKPESVKQDKAVVEKPKPQAPVAPSAPAVSINPKSIELSPSSKKKSAADPKVVKELESMFDSEDEAKEIAVKEPKKIRKKRKITKQRTFMDGKYLKTEDYDSWESYSEYEQEPIMEQVKKPESKKQKTSNTTGKKNQKSLLSFFGK